MSTPSPLRGNISAALLAREVVDVLEGRRQRAALATVTGRSGSAPQRVGAKLLLHEDGTLVGTVGGGAIEAQVVAACEASIREGRSSQVQAHLVRDLAMCCGGAMEVFVEYLQPQPRLVVIGAGHVAQSLAPLAVSADFRLTVLDEREELLEHPAFVGMQTGAYDVDELEVAVPDLDDRDYVLIMTHDHARDERALAHLLRRPFRYLGMIGSRRKVHAVLRRVLAREEQRGRPRPDLSRVRAPIGLALGGRTPAEIAVSVVAELIADRHGGSGQPMTVVPEVDRPQDAQPELQRPSESE
ncbi:MAG: XdhC family protein [Nannocystales bacterium]